MVFRTASGFPNKSYCFAIFSPYILQLEQALGESGAILGAEHSPFLDRANNGRRLPRLAKLLTQQRFCPSIRSTYTTMSGCFIEWNYKTLTEATRAAAAPVYSEESLRALDNFLGEYDTNPTVQSMSNDSMHLMWARSLLERVRTTWALRIRGDSASSCSETFSEDHSSTSEDLSSHSTPAEPFSRQSDPREARRITIASLLN